MLDKLTKQRETDKKRKGRGGGSGLGKTSGRGHKGQKSRSGVAIKSFEGGQMPLYRRLPKRGFKQKSDKKYIAKINLKNLQQVIQNKKILSDKEINLSDLQKSKIVSKKYNKLKLLGSGELKEKFDIKVNFISKSAKSKIEKLGGKVSLIK